MIQNNSARAIVDFDTFSIGAGETTTINQITNNSAILNRVTGGDITEIFGTLESNGQVFLINPSGILIGESGLVDTNGFVASTLDVDNSEFLNGGDLVFKQGVEAGNGITVHGRIRSVSGGDIFLLSREIEVGTTGSITSAGGTVGLGAGEEILLKPADDGNGRIVIRAGKGKITNRGTIEAISAELHAAGGNEYALAINNTGVIRATGASTSGGRVLLTGGGTVKNTGTVRATRKVRVRSTRKIINRGTVRSGTADQGGSVVFDAPDIVVENGSLIDVSGALGGGRAFIGGGFQGGTTDSQGNEIDITQNAQSTVVQAGAVINASSSQGDAGEVIIWADGSTEFAGTLDASSDAGAGGFAEVSGKQTLNIAGISVDLSGATESGSLLLDPDNITISAAAGSNTATGVNTILDDDIEAILNTGTNVTIATGGAAGSVAAGGTPGNLANFASGGGADVGDITFEEGTRIFFTNSGGAGNANALLTFDAANDIIALDDVLVQNNGTGDVTTNQGGIILNAGNDIILGEANDRAAGVAFGSEFGVTTLTAGNDIILQGGNQETATASATFAFAHVGVILDGARSDIDRNGTIRVTAGNDLTLIGGTTDDSVGGNDGRVNFAQIGHGGSIGEDDAAFTTEEANGFIVVDVTNALTLRGGDDLTSGAVIGHGAVITNANDLGIATSASADPVYNIGDLSGNITVTAATATVGDFTPSNTVADDVTGNDNDQVLARIGHGAQLQVVDVTNDDFQGTSFNVNAAFGRIQGRISINVEGALVVGETGLSPNTTDDNFELFSTIGHGSTYALAFTDEEHVDQASVTHGDIDGFRTPANDEAVDDFTTVITIDAGSTTVQSGFANVDNSGDPLNNNSQRAQIGHSPISIVDVSAGATSAGQNILVQEGRITGDIRVTDTDSADASGITVIATIAEGDVPASNFDRASARIGHAGVQDVQGLQGADDGGFASSVTIAQAHILDADIIVDTQTQNTADIADGFDGVLVRSIAGPGTNQDR